MVRGCGGHEGSRVQVTLVRTQRHTIGCVCQTALVLGCCCSHLLYTVLLTGLRAYVPPDAFALHGSTVAGVAMWQTSVAICVWMRRSMCVIQHGRCRTTCERTQHCGRFVPFESVDWTCA
ncbi:hypothetical protein C8Q80DRAFT_1155649 [Daedaleopsis nitida]|nr:hypothetical protein C8Q80DRAFT_1155649 [Daedaleopsis nitida]